MLRSILIQAMTETGANGLVAAVAFVAVALVLNGWLAVEPYLRGRRDGRLEMTRKSKVTPDLEWEPSDGQC